MSDTLFSIVLPARNEASNLKKLLPEICRLYPEAEVVVVDDGSTDDTAVIAQDNGADQIVTHPYAMGNGAAIKSGARVAKGRFIVFMDADGQHQPKDLSRLMSRINDGYDMVIGARNAHSQASISRLAANTFYNKLASWVVGHPIPDLTSGYRIVKANKFKRFLYLLPNGFSYPTTITMAFFRAGYAVEYLPIETLKRGGKSHVSPLKDGIRFLIIIFKIGTLYSPLKVFAPAGAIFFLLALARYLYTYLLSGAFTNMSALLFITSVLVFLLGLISEQIAALMYAHTNDEAP